MATIERPSLNRLERDLYDLAQMRLSQIWGGSDHAPTWNEILETVTALNSMPDFHLEPESRHRVDQALDAIYEPARQWRAARRPE